MDLIKTALLHFNRAEGEKKPGVLIFFELYINIMINFDIKEEQETDILKRKSKSLNLRYKRADPHSFNNSKLVFAFHKNMKPQQYRYEQSRKNKTQRLNSLSIPEQGKGLTLAINSNLDFQMLKVPSSYNHDKKAELLKKKSLSIIKASQKLGTYKSLSLFKKNLQGEPEVKLSRTQILKSILIQYDRNVESKAYLTKNTTKQKEKSYFLTELSESNEKPVLKSNSKSLQHSKQESKIDEQFNRSNSKRNYQISLNNNQIQMIVRKSLKEIDKEKQLKQSKRKQASKSLISFTQKSAYIKKMKRVQTVHEGF